MNILGIETSCDETAAAVVKDGRELLSNVVATQIDIHKVFGGVVPEVAARSHIEAMLPVVNEALEEAFPAEKDKWSQIDAIAVTTGPGLSGSLLIGTITARTLALIKDKPLYGVNHVLGHVYANFITEGLGALSKERNESAHLDKALGASRRQTAQDSLEVSRCSSVRTSRSPRQSTKPTPTDDEVKKDSNYDQDTSNEWIEPKFPLLALIVSGGHTQLALFRGHYDYELLGQTQDDAVGEAFDKVAKVLGLEYPGGPSIQKSAEQGGDPNKYEFPKASSRVTKAADSPGVQGAGEKQTEVYKEYSEGVSQPATKQSSESVSSATSSGGRQARLVSGLGPYDFSFSGLKTAVLRQVQVICGKDHTFPSFELSELLTSEQVKDVAASFQRIAIETLVDKTLKAYQEYKPATVVIAGGVAANTELRRQLRDRLPLDINYAPINLCTDNAAMIAALGYYHAQQTKADDPYKLEINTSLKM